MTVPETPTGPRGDTMVAERAAEAPAATVPWVTIVWDDPVNLFSYVIHVFETYFRFPRERAERLTMQVHTEGKAVVASGSREEMERHVEAMHAYGLWASLEHQ